MHGIHGLADAELRPHVFGATFQYNNGVDLAVGRKARQDFAESLLEIGAMVDRRHRLRASRRIVAAAAAGVVGIGFAVEDVLDAAEKEEIYRSLEDPETVLSWQEVAAGVADGQPQRGLLGLRCRSRWGGRCGRAWSR